MSSSSLLACSWRCRISANGSAYRYTSETKLSRVIHRHVSNKYKPLPGKVAPETIKAVSHNTKTPRPHRKPAVNPPESSLPPHLDVPERKPTDGTVRYYLRVGKSYLGFYKTAAKAIWSNRRECKLISAGIRAKSSKGSSTTPATAVKSGLITRAEFQFLLRSSRDVKKLPLLVVLLVITGEWLPLIAIYVPGLVPKTAWIPKQVDRVRSKIEKRREESFRHGTLLANESLSAICRYQNVKDLAPSQRIHISRALGLHSTLWETFWDRPPQWLASMKVQKAMDYLTADDLAINRDGGSEALSDEEVKMACEERGIDILKEKVPTLRERLKLYFEARSKDNIGIPALTLVRPNQWESLRRESTRKT